MEIHAKPVATPETVTAIKNSRDERLRTAFRAIEATPMNGLAPSRFCSSAMRPNSRGGAYLGNGIPSRPASFLSEVEAGADEDDAVVDRRASTTSPCASVKRFAGTPRVDDFDPTEYFANEDCMRQSSSPVELLVNSPQNSAAHIPLPKEMLVDVQQEQIPELDEQQYRPGVMSFAQQPPMSLVHSVGYPLLYFAGLTLLSLPILCFYIFIPITSRKKSFYDNWAYTLVQPMVTYGYISGGSAYCCHAIAAVCFGIKREGLLRSGFAAWSAGFLFGGLFGVLSLDIIVRFVGFYPLNALVAFLIHGSIVYEVIRRMVPRIWFPDHDEIIPHVTHLANVGNAYLLAIALSVGFLVAYYKVPSGAQIFLLIAFEGLMAGVNQLMWVYCVKHLLHPGLYSVIWFSTAFIRDVFVMFAYPSTISSVTLALLIVAQIIRAGYGLFSLSEKWFELRQRLHSRFRPGSVFPWTKRMMLMRLVHVALASAGRLTATAVYVILAVGYRYGPNADYLPTGTESGKLFVTALAFSAITACASTIQIFLNGFVVWRLYRIPVWDLLGRYGMKSPEWRWLTAWFAMNAFVVVHLVIQSHANLLRLVRPSLFAD
eukprot:TRINITY_DN13092_c0_g1_i1.p1 TRINITY_DN13092_c0_g1~~TRINITY_DN13092_c0_g1_i1.p1  ORF type:complete len:600 (-),score=63.50 TRINITY_DN13092_c0_g1_i1:328-2127(-)